MDINEIREFVKATIEEATGETVENDTLLFDEEIVDSMNILYLIEEVEEKYSITLPLDEVVESNYSSVNVIADYIAGKLS